MNFGVLIFPNVEELDFVGPWEIAGMWSKVGGGPENRLIVAQSTAPVICAKGLSVNPHVSFRECPALDILLVPGGEGTRKEVENKELVNFIAVQFGTEYYPLSKTYGSLHQSPMAPRYLNKG